MGRGFGTVLILLGVLNLISGGAISGVWLALIGFFLIAAASSSETRMALHAGLEDRTVSQIMVRNPVSIPAETPLDTVIEDYFYRHHHTAFPVVCNGALLGCIRIEDVGRVQREDRMLKTAADVLSAEGHVATVSPDTPAMNALKTMQEHRTSRLMVVEKDVLKGVLTMREILNHLSIRQQLETDRSSPEKAPLANA